MNSSRLLPEIGAAVVIAAVLSAGLILALQPVLQRYALARPNARSSHSLPTPQGGGFAVIAATILSVATVSLLSHPQDVSTALWIVLAATAVMAAVGAIDDLRTIEVVPRLLLQAALVGIVIAAIPAEARIFQMLPWWIERGLWLLAGVWFVNLVNFMDGLDWMTVAETIPVAAALVLAGLTGTLPDHATVAAAALAGAILGFAPFNRPVAALFLGDVGSLPIGLLQGWLLATLATNGHLAAAVLLPLYYLADATCTLIRRIINGERPWEAHRTHYYQRATAHGFSVRQIIARVFVVNSLLAALAMFTIWMPTRGIEAVALAVGGLLVAGLLLIFSRGRR